jgi:hypothetical protein
MCSLPKIPLTKLKNSRGTRSVMTNELKKKKKKRSKSRSAMSLKKKKKKEGRDQT